MWLLDLIIGRERREQMRQLHEDVREARETAQRNFDAARKAALDRAESGAHHRHVYDNTVREMETLTGRVSSLVGGVVKQVRDL